MKKNLIAFPVLISVVCIVFILVTSVTLQVNSIPEEVDAGDTFIVQYTINKGDINSFAHFVQELPPGVTAVPLNTPNAVDFSVKERNIRIIWLKLPESEEFTIAYSLRLDERVKGSFSLSGKFSYIENNEKMFKVTDPVTIKIIPSKDIDSSLIVDIKDFDKKYIMPGESESQQGEAPLVIRQKPQVSEDNRSAVINILVNKEKLKQFGKIEEVIPDGFTPLKIDTKGGDFSYHNGQIKFVWKRLPTEPFFFVSYKIVADSGYTVDENLNIRGGFSYLENNMNYYVDMIEKDNNLKAMNAVELNQYIASLKPKQSSAGSKYVANRGSDSKESIFGKNPILQGAGGYTGAASASSRRTTGVYESKKGGRLINSIEALALETGVNYRVQVAASHKRISKRYFVRKKINEEVKVESHKGWLKYSVGSYKEYKDAREHRIDIWNNTAVGDAFIASYFNGKRITIQEALMSTNQEWYK